MEKYFFMRPLLDKLTQTGFMNRLTAITLRVTAALTVLLSLVTFFKAGKVMFDLPPSGILGGILFQIFYILAIYAVVHVLIIRAADIENLRSPEFNMLSLSALLLRALGETLASFVALIAVGGGIYVWFTAKPVASILDPVPGFVPTFGDGKTFMGGIEFMVGGILMSILALICFYTVSDILTLLSESAKKQVERRRAADNVTSAEQALKFRSGT